MALRSAATIATTAKRRGASALGVGDFIWLQENKREVKKITALLDGQADIARAAEKKSAEAEALATSRLAEAVEAEAALTERENKFQEVVTEAETKRLADQDLLAGRIKAADEENGRLKACSTAQDNREEGLDARERDHETEFQAREEAVEVQEAAADQREQVTLKETATLKKHAATITTAAKMMRQAAALLAKL